MKRAALALSLLATVACGDGSPHTPGPAPRIEATGGLLRLGVAADRVVQAGVSKPVLPLSTEPVIELAFSELPAGAIDLAVTLQGPPGLDGNTSASCRVLLVREGNDGAELDPVGQTLTAKPGQWSEASLMVAAPVARGRLRLDCAAPEGTLLRWAQPVAASRGGAAKAPLLVLISLDTLRADHVSGFGGPEGLTPELEALGAEGVRFQSTSTEGTWTLPSHYAMLRSALYGYDVERGRPRSVAEVLAENGYRTLAATGGGFVGVFFYFDQGFDHFDERWKGTNDLVAQVDDVLARLERMGDVPTFLFFHTYAVHEKSALEQSWYDEQGSWHTFRPSQQDAHEIRDFYASLVGRMDQDLAPLFAALRAQAEERPVLVVLTSYHGEAFLEHGGFRHGYNRERQTLHDELTRVPMIVWGPGLIPSNIEIASPVMLSNIAPSLLEATGIDRPASMMGNSLWPVWTGHSDLNRSPGALSQTDGSWALRAGSHKLIAKVPPIGEDAVLLYDVENDPGEQVDLIDREGERASAMVEQLRTRLGDFGVSSSPGMLPECPDCRTNAAGSFLQGVMEDDPAKIEIFRQNVREETEARLKALGYVEE